MSDQLSPRVSLRGKLERLMLFRVLMVTLLLGSAIAINFNDANSFSDPTYVTIFTLIIVTYVATIIYAMLVRRLEDVRVLAYSQILGDVFLAAGLVYVTGGTQSIFAFLLYLTIINGAILMGRRAGLTAATLSSVAFLAMLLMQLGYLPSPLQGGLLGTTSRSPIYNVVVNITAFYLVALLAGYLARRLEEQNSELAQKQLDIRELQALNQNILSSVNSGVLTLDQQERVLFLNRAAEGILGSPMESLYGRHVSSALPEMLPAVESLIRHTAALGEDLPASLLEGHASALWEGWLSSEGVEEPCFVSISHSSLYDVEDKPYGHILVLQDLTLIHRMRGHVQRQERLAAVGQLAAAIAHEIRNPLASISGSVEMLKMFIDAGEDEERLMNIVIREIDRLNGLISEFLEYTRSRRRSRISVSLHDIIEETVEMFRMDRAMLREIKVHLNIEACRGRDILADVEGVRQVFWNLLRNAAEAMEGKGLIQVEVLAGVMTPGEPLSLLKVDAENQETSEASGFRILVSDDGPGIRPEHQARIFEPFFSTKPEGTGLGLATIYRIVEDHDGLIQVDSSDKGTTFRIDLPLSQQPIGAMLASKQALGLMGGRALQSQVLDFQSVGAQSVGSQALDLTPEEAQALLK